MVVKRKTAYNFESVRAIIHLEKPPDQSAGIDAVGFINAKAIDDADRLLLFTALGYVPYEGGDTANSKLFKKIRQPLWEIAQRVLEKRNGS